MTRPNDNAGRCRSCRKPVLWAITQKGARIPVDPEPVPNGNIELRDDGNGEIRSTTVKPDPSVRKYVAHFATCPNANNHRRKR